jgi:hypothetical protein
MKPFLRPFDNLARVAVWLSGVLFGLPALSPSVAAAADTAVPKDAREAMESNATWLSPLSVTWEERNALAIPKTDFESSIGPIPGPAFFEPTRVLFRYQNRMYYTLRTFHALGKDGQMQAHEAEISFDLNNIYSGNKLTHMKREGSDPLITITPLDDHLRTHPEHYALRTEFLERAGFALPERYRELRLPPKSRVLSLIDGGARVTSVVDDKAAGAAKIVIELATKDRIHRFTLDPSRRFAVLREEELTSAGKLVVRTECEGFVALAGAEVHLPTTIRVSHFNWYSAPEKFSDAPLIVTTYTTSNLSHDPIAPGEFILTPKYLEPGTVVGDGSLPEAAKLPGGRVTYVVPADPSDLKDAIEAAKRRERFIPASQRYRTIAILISVNVAIISVLAILYRVYRGRAGEKGSHAPETA